MPTATKPKSVLVQLAQREEKVSILRADSHEAGRLLRDALAHIEGLHDQRRRLIYADPSLVDADGTAVDPKNAIGLIDQELGNVPDADALRRSYLHATRLAESAEQAVRDFSEAWRQELTEAMTQEAEVRAASATIALDALRGEIRDLVLYLHRYEAVTTHQSPALDPLARLLAELDRVGVPEVTR